MISSRAAAILVALAVVFTAPAAAQSPFGFELRGGPSFATRDLGDAALDLGVGFEGTLTFWPMPHTGVYGGWDWHHFGVSDPSFLGDEVDVEETGYAFGLRFEHPLGRPGSTAVALRLGGTVNHIEVEDDGGELVTDSGHGLGWEAMAGFAIPLRGWRVVPSLRFRSLARDLEVDGASTAVELSYFAVEIGFARRF